MHKTFRDSKGPSACVCGPQASHIRNIVLPVDKTKYLVVHKTFSDSTGPSEFVCGPQASPNRNTVLPVDKLNICCCTRNIVILYDHLHVYFALKPLTKGILYYL